MTNWVKARANCTPQDVFRRISARLLIDANAYNRLYQQKKFKVVNNSTTRVFRAREVIVGPNKTDLSIHPDHKQDFVELRIVDGHLVASRNGQWQLELVPHWNEKDLSCELIVDSEVLSEEHVSQRILGDFMFG